MNDEERRKLKEECDNLPVYYCTRCLSLRIRSVEVMESEFCDDCGSTNVATTDMGTWRRLYREKYGKDYMDNY